MYYPTMLRRRMAWIAVSVLVYSALALAVIAPTSMVERITERPGPSFAILLIAVGPLALFAPGTAAWPFVAGVLAAIAICSGLSYLAWRKSPQSEWFVFWLFCAALCWAGSPWLLVVSGI